MRFERNDYFPNANLVPPKWWTKGEVKIDKSISVIPKDIILRNDESKFDQNSKRGQELGRYLYYVVDEVDVRSDIIVAMNPDYPHQRVVGPRSTVEEVMHAYYILDNIYPGHQLRDMDVIVGSRRLPISNTRKDYTIDKKGYFSMSLLENLNLLPFLSRSKYRKPRPNAPALGVYCDIEYPIFFIAEQLKNTGYNIVYHAHSLVHDWTHVVQNRIENYPMDSRAIEIQAITNGHNFTSSLIRHPVMRWLSGRDLYLLHLFLKRGDKYIKSYLSNGGGHVKSKLRDENVKTDYTLPQHLYEYGKSTKFNY